MRYKFTKEDYENAAMVSKSIAGVCRELNIRPVGGNYKTINNKIKEYGINIEHFTGGAWNVGDRFKPFNKGIKMEDILSNKVKYVSGGKLRKRLIDGGYKRYVCEKCGLSEWMGRQIPLELNHINGDNMDNRLDNLEILCCNCHAQTDNWRGRNIKKSSKSEYRLKKNKVKSMTNSFVPDKIILENMLLNFSLKDISVNFNVGVMKVKKWIKNYDIIFNRYRMTNKLKKVKINTRKVDRPAYDVLMKEIEDTNYCAVGRKYGVSDNAIRKWVKLYENN